MSSILLAHEQRIHGPWVKLQSEPKLFTALMYDLGVRGAQATEVFVLDDIDLLGEIYGFVYLFRMIGKNLYDAEDYTPVENPDNVYFANQVVGNACATLAVLNIALNSPRMEIGDELREFKEFTKDFNPPTKGFAITNHPSFRLIHNSMSRHPEEALVVEEASGKSSGKSSGKFSAAIDDTLKEMYHYIAYVPIDGEVWQLDGLYPHPVSVGKYENKKNWHNAAREVMQTRIQGFYADQIDFVLLAITKDQIGIKEERVKECVYLKRITEAKLNKLDSQWKVAVVDDININLSESETIEVCERGSVKMEIEKLNSNGDDINNLLQLREKWIDEIRDLQKTIVQENRMKQNEKERQIFDYGPFLREYISILHERGELEELLDRADNEEYEVSF